MGDPCGKTYLRNAANDGWITVAVGAGVSGSGGATTFLGLSDTPSVYTGAANKVVSVKSDGSGLEFTAASSGAAGFDTDLAVTKSGNTNCNHTTDTKIVFDTVITDGNTEWDAANTRWQCKTAGTYIVNAAIQWAASGSGHRRISIFVDGAISQYRIRAGCLLSSQINQEITHKIALTAGQYVEIYGYQNSGGTLAVVPGSPATQFQIWRVK